MKQFTFTTRDKLCTDLGIMCIHANIYDTSPETVKDIEVTGAFSPLLLFEKNRERFKLIIKVVIKAMPNIDVRSDPKGEPNIYETLSHIREWYMSDHEDKPIHLSNVPDSYWEGFLYNIINIQDYNDNLVTCDLEFNCKPLRQLSLGDEPHDGEFISGQSNIIRALKTCAPSRPTIVISPPPGLNKLTIEISSGGNMVNNRMIKLNGLRALPPKKQLIISGELQECYYIDDNNTIIPCNHLMHGDFPEVFKGILEIRGSEMDVATPIPFKVYPRWRVI